MGIGIFNDANGLLFSISARVPLYAPSNRQDSTLPRPLLNHSWSNESIMKDRYDDPSRHERMLLPRSYISFSHFVGMSPILWECEEINRGKLLCDIIYTNII